jgi:RNAse (barnase) inhibitor barstar
MMTATSIVHHVQTVDPPWFQLLVLQQGQEVDLENRLSEISGFSVRTIDGKRCKNHCELFSEFSRALKFPAYFGNNWAALDECITDLEWAPAKGYVLLIKDAEELLIEDSQEECSKFIRIMKKAGEEWSIPQVGEWPRGATPFHILSILQDHKRQVLGDWGIPLLSLDVE